MVNQSGGGEDEISNVPLNLPGLVSNERTKILQIMDGATLRFKFYPFKNRLE
jgi:hypothetical protein